MFNAKTCDACGECLERCPELSLGREEAREEIKRLIAGDESRYVLTRCSSCLSCNVYCPKECNPYQLILSRWNERYRRVGSPALWKFVFPTEKSNLWSGLHAILPEKARNTVESWMTGKPSESIFLPGSFFHLVPEVLEGSRLLHGLSTLALPGHWECGAYLYQGGYLDVVSRIGRMVRDDLDRWGVKRVVTGLDAVHIMFTKIHPEENGIRFNQEFIGFHDWILQGLQDGSLHLGKKLGRTVTVHDNCYAKALGTYCFDQARTLLDLSGVRVLEMRHHHEDALCCGFGRGASWKRNLTIPFDILRGTVKRIREAEETGADTLVTYCAGCFWLLLAGCELSGSSIRVMHLMELVREAMGEEAVFPRKERARDILAVLTFKILQESSRRNVWIETVKAEPDPAEWRDRPQRLLKAFRASLNTRAGQRAFRTGFSWLDKLMA